VHQRRGANTSRRAKCSRAACPPARTTSQSNEEVYVCRDIGCSKSFQRERRPNHAESRTTEVGEIGSMPQPRTQVAGQRKWRAGPTASAGAAVAQGMLRNKALRGRRFFACRVAAAVGCPVRAVPSGRVRHSRAAPGGQRRIAGFVRWDVRNQVAPPVVPCCRWQMRP